MSASTVFSSERVQEDARLLDCVRTYDRIAPVYDLMDAIYERSWKRRLRAELFRHAQGRRLLDVGVGTGCNMPFYPPELEVVGIDNSHAMLARADERARTLNRPVELHRMNLLELGFPDASFDTVAVTFVLLCLPDELQTPALSELRRVVRPDGRILVLDYHKSTRRSTRLRMRMFAPWLRWAFAARFDPKTEGSIGPSGLRVARRQSFMGDSVSLLVLEPAVDRGERAGIEVAA